MAQVGITIHGTREEVAAAISSDPRCTDLITFRLSDVDIDQLKAGEPVAVLLQDWLGLILYVE